MGTLGLVHVWGLTCVVCRARDIDHTSHGDWRARATRETDTGPPRTASATGAGAVCGRVRAEREALRLGLRRDGA